MNRRETLGLGATAALASLALAKSGAAAKPRIVQAYLKDGRLVQGTAASDTLTLQVGDKIHGIPLDQVLSVHSASPAVATEAARITAGFSALKSKDLKASEAAQADLTDLGLPVITPLLRAYEDVDAHEPDPLYRLFARIIPGYADGPDRTLDLVRLADGSAMRGKLQLGDFTLKADDGTKSVLPGDSIRRLAVRQASISRVIDLQALRDCTYVGWVDTGAWVTSSSKLTSDAQGYVRLSFDEDGWACDPDGIADPLPGKRRLQEGFRWGAILGRVGPGGERWLIGKHMEKSALGEGRLYIVVNDNEHWQNNIGSYRAKLKITDAYDLAEAQ
jgi:hypothetical protein